MHLKETLRRRAQQREDKAWVEKIDDEIHFNNDKPGKPDSLKRICPKLSKKDNARVSLIRERQLKLKEIRIIEQTAKQRESDENSLWDDAIDKNNYVDTKNEGLQDLVEHKIRDIHVLEWRK
eukprot:Awhi_evm1s10572